MYKRNKNSPLSFSNKLFIHILFFTIFYAFTTNNFSQVIYWEKIINNIYAIDIKAASNGNLFCSCGTGQYGIYKSTDGGNSWSFKYTGEHITKIAIDANDIIYAGVYASEPGILKSTDYGETWSAAYLSLFNAAALTISPEGYIYAVETPGNFLRSEDQGITWTFTSIINAEANGIACTSTGILFAVTYAGLFTSTDHGDTWNQISHPNLLTFLNTITIDQNNYIYVDHDQQISRSTDNGISWSLVGNLHNVYNGSLDVNNSGELFFGYNGVYKSSDSGITWDYLGGSEGFYLAFEFFDDKIYAGTSEGLIRHDPAVQFYIGNNYLPLNTGNKWQYIREKQSVASGFGGVNHYSLVNIEAGSDTLLNNKKYWKFRNDWVRYSEEDKKIFLWYNDTPRVFMDMITVPGALFNQCAQTTHQFRFAKMLHGFNTFNGDLHNYKGYNYDPGTYAKTVYEELFAEDIGMISSFTENTGSTLYDYYHILDELIMAVIYDSLGIPLYISDHHKPQIQLNPIWLIDTSKFIITFPINHFYNRAKNPNNPLEEDFNFIDSVYFEYFYHKGDSVLQPGIIKAAYAGSFTYKVQKLLDTFLMKDGYTFNYRIRAVDKTIKPEVSYKPIEGYYSCSWQFPADVIDNKNTPSDFCLYQNFPNPFNPSTVITYQIPKEGLVNLKIFDILGTEIKTLVSEYKSAGIYSEDFNAASLPSGIYICRIHAGEYTSSIKMILIK